MSADESTSALFQQFLEWKRSMKSTSTDVIPQEEDKEVSSPSSHSNASTEEKTLDFAKPASQHSSSSQPGGSSPSQVSSYEFTATQYLGKSGKKNQSPQATKKFRHILKVAAMEAKVWGCGMTLKQISPAQRKHIHDRVIGECPSLKGHLRELDAVLARSLINSNYYQSAKQGKKPSKQLEKQKEIPHKSNKEKSKLKGSEREKEELKRAKATKRNKNPVCKEKSKIKPGGGSEHFTDATAVVPCGQTSSNKLNPGDEVLILQEGEPIATAVVVCLIDPGMYCQVRFKQHLSEDPKEEDIELPQPIPPSGDCEKKLYIWQLEEGDIFLWKNDKLKRNIPSKGYVIGVPSKKDIFSMSELDGSKSGPRVRQKNPKYSN